MPTIAITSPKGGSGKTTLALVLATTLAEYTGDVVLIDADPNQPLVSWADGAVMDGLQVTSADEASVAEIIGSARQKVDWVVVDTEGTASLTALRAIALADLVLIPMTPSPIDSMQAARLVRAIHAIRKTAGRLIEHRVVFTRTPVTTKTRVERLLIEEIAKMNIPQMSTQLHARNPFIAMFAYRRTLADLLISDSDGLASARANARALAKEVISMVPSSSKTSSQATGSTDA